MAEIRFEHVCEAVLHGRRRPAVNDLSFAVNDGELLILLGPSGCGKTTALRMIAGLEEPDSGDIRIDGQSVVGMEPEGSRYRPRLPAVRAVSASERATTICSTRLKIQKHLEAGAPAPHRSDRRIVKIGHLLDRETESALRRRAATGGARTGDRAPAARVSDGRATFEPRRQAAHPHAHGDQDAAARTRYDHGLRHP